MQELLVEIFCSVDDFCVHFENYCKSVLMAQDYEHINEFHVCSSKNLALSEIMTIVIYFHLSHYRNFKHYYIQHVCGVLKPLFPKVVSYNRFVELMQEALIPLLLYMNMCRLGKCTGISFLDSTTLDVCHNRRIYSHKVFKHLSERGKSSTGWFYGFKLHLAINENGEILSFFLTPGNVDDRDLQVIQKVTSKLFGKLFADRGYISQKLSEILFSKGIQLITKIKKNMKNKLMLLQDKLLLRKRAVIESVNDFLKNVCQIEHTRHRSVTNFMVNIVSGLVAYSFLPKKPSIKANCACLTN
jgi:hypothetical protein